MTDPARIGAAVEPLRRDPRHTAVLSDFDGTIAPIVPYPDAARPPERAVALLHRLARLYACVAVVSGRPASFLAEHLELGSRKSGLRAIGLYGLEEADGAGGVTSIPVVEAWRPVVAEAAARVDAAAPPGVTVEKKGLSVTMHWRRHPDAEAAAIALAALIADELGLETRAGRMAIELTPPVGVDKGVVVTELCSGMSGALYVGDDLGDLPAFRALEVARAGGLYAVRAAAVSDETPPEVLAEADLTVDGPAGAVELLGLLASPLA